MWICLKTRKNIVIKGEMISYQPGDWINIGKQLGQEWIAAGDAYTLDPATLNQDLDPTAGIVIRGAVSDEWRKKVEEIATLKVAFVGPDWDGDLPFTENLIWTSTFDLRLDLLLVGFKLLHKWQIAMPLLDYTTLAAHIGNDEERAQTQAIIRDLRVPVRDTRLIFVRRCEDTRRLFSLWREPTGGDERLAFLRALYTVKPIICDLPASWTGRA